jgi:hypothetical protein
VFFKQITTKVLMSEVTVIINNRDLLLWPAAMCAKLDELDGLCEIIILDNGSSNRELLQWYKACPYKVLFLDNLGHKAPWTSGILPHLRTDLYVVTDSDLDLSSIPKDTLLHLTYLLRKYPDAGKVGLSLQTDCIPKSSPYYEHVLEYEAKRQSFLVNEEIYLASVDTTFAIYDRQTLSKYAICGVRSKAPYMARHIPWEISDPKGDFLYYLQNCNDSSSYKSFTKFGSSSKFIAAPLQTSQAPHS